MWYIQKIYERYLYNVIGYIKKYILEDSHSEIICVRTIFMRTDCCPYKVATIQRLVRYEIFSLKLKVDSHSITWANDDSRFD